MLHAVILAGGSGTRLWPLSRAHYPKQFLQLLGSHTFLQQTVLRLGAAVSPERLWVVTGKEHEFVVRAQLASLPGFDGNAAHILVEPLPKNTAAAIGLAALHARQYDPEAVMAVLPADHWIEHQSAFPSLLQSAAELARQGMLVTLGVVPDRPETGYGYIRRGAPVAASQSFLPHGHTAYLVEQFVEKPDLATAQHYLADGAYYWNAGIFLWQASTILEEIAATLPTLHQELAKVALCLDSDKAADVLATVYSRLESVSIDYGVLEKSARLIVIPADIGWSDLGDWHAIHRLSPQDARGNVLSPQVFDLDSENSFICGSGRTIATIGLKNTVVIDTEDALLVCPHDRVQEVRTVVQQLKARGGTGVTYLSRTVHRPWGTYTVLEERDRFKVKRVVVHPEAALSLQLHHYRSEHWVVVTGIAQVTNGSQTFFLQVGQSTYVPQGTIHRLANPGAEPLEIIEVQTGSYLGEDDIVRFDDFYRRESP